MGCAFPMVVNSMLPHAEFGPNDHWEDEPHSVGPTVERRTVEASMKYHNGERFLWDLSYRYFASLTTDVWSDVWSDVLYAVYEGWILVTLILSFPEISFDFMAHIDVPWRHHWNTIMVEGFYKISHIITLHLWLLHYLTTKNNCGPINQRFCPMDWFEI